jgi:hypothetical protein
MSPTDRGRSLRDANAEESSASAGAGYHPAGGHPACDGPVIVLTMARSGSTLLRFILDSHPELTCPRRLALERPASR